MTIQCFSARRAEIAGTGAHQVEQRAGGPPPEGKSLGHFGKSTGASVRGSICARRACPSAFFELAHRLCKLFRLGLAHGDLGRRLRGPQTTQRHGHARESKEKSQGRGQPREQSPPGCLRKAAVLFPVLRHHEGYERIGGDPRHRPGLNRVAQGRDASGVGHTSSMSPGQNGDRRRFSAVFRFGHRSGGFRLGTVLRRKPRRGCGRGAGRPREQGQAQDSVPLRLLAVYSDMSCARSTDSPVTPVLACASASQSHQGLHGRLAFVRFWNRIDVRQGANALGCGLPRSLGIVPAFERSHEPSFAPSFRFFAQAPSHPVKVDRLEKEAAERIAGQSVKAGRNQDELGTKPVVASMVSSAASNATPVLEREACQQAPAR